MSESLELAVLLDRVWLRRRAVIAIIVVGTLAMAGIALLLPNVYRAQATLLPPVEEESGLGIVNLLRGIGVPGVKVPTRVATADVFIAVLQSRRVGEEMVGRFDLRTRYRKQYIADALKELHSYSRFELTSAGLIEIAVTDRDPEMAAHLANAYVQLLDQINREVRMTKGRRTRMFLERRLAETRDSLRECERRLAEYQSTNKGLALSPAMSSSMESAGNLYAQRAALQIRLGVIRSYTRGPTDDVLQIEQQLAQIDSQLASMPVTGLELARLYRDAKANEQLYILLTGQHEEARIEEARDVVTVEVLDVAKPPERKWRPKRLLLIAAGFGISLVSALGLALIAPAPTSRGAG